MARPPDTRCASYEESGATGAEAGGVVCLAEGVVMAEATVASLGAAVEPVEEDLTERLGGFVLG